MSKKGDLTKQSIKAKAIRLFAQKGFKDVTMKDICEVTELSRGGLYLHYSSTKQIFSDIIDDLMNAQGDEFSEKIEQGLSAKEILLQVLERYKNEMMDAGSSLSVAIYEFFSSETSKQNNALFQQYQKSYFMWKRLLEYGISRREFNTVDIDAIFDLIVFSYQGVRMYSTLMAIDERTPNHIISLIKTILLPDEEV
ncbi:MAG TPA: TetR/AcrR family transcriptional regulator [Clostridia bacterium]|jgi:AcrR family transcriptional regulator|nr:TetR/AcrR family transcriptional regulator [Clostridia bacterium]HOL61270.1 TetR/AcrR family transcriptional regulator [Clostridia bacterium]HOM98256.1 TetR/AcrR family transcriptional regulator [Acetomicrobium sp.]HPO53665.1 TetR/AcrR family transcriptional regulator [Clostridia bacterium]